MVKEDSANPTDKRVRRSAAGLFELVAEGKTSLIVPKVKALKSAPAFFNPDAELSRSVCVGVLFSLNRKNLKVADVLGGVGARSIRILNEISKNAVKKVFCNDLNLVAVKNMKKNIQLNKIKSKIEVSNKEGNVFLMSLGIMDYIDIDPFGSPVPFLDSACKRLGKNSVLALAATDTAALSGASFSACVRKYGSRPLHNEFMHETGIRILIKKAQEAAAQYDRALIPVFCHSSGHYVRVYLKCVTGANAARDVLKHHGFVHFCPRCLDRKVSQFNRPELCCGIEMHVGGPLWTGKLWDELLVKRMAQLDLGINYKSLLSKIFAECSIDSVGFFDLNEIAKKHHKQTKLILLIDKLNKAGFQSSTTHFMNNSVRTTASIEEVLSFI